MILASLLICFFLACGVVEKLSNRAPVIKKMSCDADSMIVITGDTVRLSVEATDPDKDALTFRWEASGGYFITHLEKTVSWIAPDKEGDYDIEVTVRDGNDGVATDKITLNVISKEKPTVTITNPKAGDSYLATGTMEIQVQIAPARFIEKVDFYVDEHLVGTDISSPYTQTCSCAGLVGQTEIKAMAWRKIPTPVTASDSILVTVEGVIPIPRRGHGYSEQ
jgi:hypothetical protein